MYRCRTGVPFIECIFLWVTDAEKLVHFKTGCKASVVHLLLWNALESMTASIILVIYLLIFPHIHLPRTVLKIYKQCLSFQALLEFFVFESEWKTNLSTQMAVSSLNSFAWAQVWHFEENKKHKNCGSLHVKDEPKW